MKLDKNARTAYRLAEATCTRLDYTGFERAVFMNVFRDVRDAELDGKDLWPLWNQYMTSHESDTADLSIAAFIEAVASTRKNVATHG